MALILNGTTGASMVQDDAVHPVTDIASGIPCFSANLSATQTVTSNVPALVNIGTEEFDTTNAFNNTTYTFTPQVAGYYSISGFILGTAVTSVQFVACAIQKNGVDYLQGNALYISTAVYVNASSVVNGIVYMNGTTDNLKLSGTVMGTGACTITTAKFQAHLIVGA